MNTKTNELIGKVAMAAFLCETEEPLTYEDYMSDDDYKDKVMHWEAVEERSFEEVQDLVDSQFFVTEKMLKTALKAIKAQIIEDTINGTFPSDANELDMMNLLERGLEL